MSRGAPPGADEEIAGAPGRSIVRTTAWLWPALQVGAPLAFFALFFVYPVASIVGLGLAPGGRLDLSVVGRVLTDPGILGIAWFTLWQAAVSTALTLLVGLPGAYLFARFAFPGKPLLRATVTLPFVLPTVVVGAAFLALLGPRSPVNALLMTLLGTDEPVLRLQHTLWAILLAHVFFNYAVVVRLVGGLWAHLDPRVEEAARTLGASPWQAFRRVTLPLLRPAIASAGAIVFLFTFTSFGVILILGGPSFATLEVEIYRQTAQLLDLRVASVLTLVQMGAVAGLLFAYGRLQERRTVRLRLRPVAEVARRPRGAAERAFVLGNLALIAVLLWLPLLVLVERSLAGTEGYGVRSFEALFGAPRGGTLFVTPVEAIRNSLLFGILATAIALPLGLLASSVVAYRRDRVGRTFDGLLMLPLGTSAVTIGFGFLVALDEPPLDLRTSVLLIPLAHALVAVPFVVRAISPVMRAIDRRLREAAAVLGASPARAWREVDLPIVSRAALVGAGFAFAVSLGEFGATAFIVRPDAPTLPVAIFRLLGQPGALNFGMAMAMSVVLMAVTAGAILLTERVRVGDLGEF